MFRSACAVVATCEMGATGGSSMPSRERSPHTNYLGAIGLLLPLLLFASALLTEASCAEGGSCGQSAAQQAVIQRLAGGATHGLAVRAAPNDTPTPDAPVAAVEKETH